MRIEPNPTPRLWHFSLNATGILLVCAIAIATTFFAVHQQRLDETIARNELMADILLSDLDNHSLSNYEHLSRRASALMELDDFLSITAVNSRGEKLFEVGMPLPEHVLGAPYTSREKWVLDDQVYLSRPMGDPRASGTWLIVAIDTTRASLSNLQFLFVTTLILFGVIIFALLYHRSLNRDIFQPLDELNGILNRQNNMRNMSPVMLKKPGIFEELIQQVNESFSIHIEKEMDFRKGIENATQELRESLETVEVHNIDLDLARKNAVELNKLKSEFLKKTSQDLRTPLSGILGFSELLKKSPLNVDQQDYVSTIEESTKGMLTIVNDIHDFSRLESGNLQVEKKSMDLRRTVEDTLTLQAPIANERGVNLYSSLDQDIPYGVLGDPLRVQQVLANLVSNAIKFENASYIEVCVHTLHRLEDQTELKIEVHTDGLPPYELENWSVQLEDGLQNSRQFYSGAGMGLSIARGIAQHMRGAVGFENAEPTRYFTFTLALDIDLQAPTPARFIDPSYQVNAIVYTNNEVGYREITSRLVELGIRNQRADSFSNIIHLAQKVKAESQKHARYLPIAIIEAQTSQQTLDKILLTQTIQTIQNELGIPTIVIAPMGKLESLKKLLNTEDVFVTQHPLVTPRFRKGLLEQLGVVKFNHDKRNHKPRSSNAPMRFLLVDDNPSNLKLATSLLSDFNADVTTATTGEEAILKFEQSRFDLVFMDIQLPDIDGFETTTRMRALESGGERTPIVALTAHNVEDEKSRLLLAGMDDIVGKPLTSSDIGQIMDRWVVGSRNKSAPKLLPPVIPDPPVETHEEPTMALSSPVNISECLALTRDDPELARDMLAMLLESIVMERPHIERAHDTKSYDELYEHIHKLHGACCYCGVPRLKRITRSMDQKLKDGDLNRIDEDMLELTTAFCELQRWHDEHDLNALFEASV